MTKTLLTFSLLANMLLVLAYNERAADYDRLLVFACERGNGGHECGEE